MTIATKTTINRLKKSDTLISKLLYECATLAQNRMDNERDGYFEGLNQLTTDAQYTDDNLYILARNHDIKLLYGLYTKYPSLVKTTVFLGTIAECTISDINKLSRLIAIN